MLGELLVGAPVVLDSEELHAPTSSAAVARAGTARSARFTLTSVPYVRICSAEVESAGLLPAFNPERTHLP